MRRVPTPQLFVWALMISVPLGFVLWRLAEWSAEAELEYGDEPWGLFTGLLSDAGRGPLPMAMATFGVIAVGAALLAAARSRSAAAIGVVRVASGVLLLGAIVIIAPSAVSDASTEGYWAGFRLETTHQHALPALRVVLALAILGFAGSGLLALFPGPPREDPIRDGEVGDSD